MRTLIYGIRSLFRNFAGSPLLHSLTVTTVAVGMLMIVVFRWGALNLSGWVEIWRTELQITAFAKTGADERNLKIATDKIRSLPDVESVQLRTPAEGLAELKTALGIRGDLLSGDNPLPHAWLIQSKPHARSAQATARLAGELIKLPQIDSVEYGAQWLERFERFVSAIRYIGASLGLFLAIAALLIVSNTLSLTLFNRQREIEILDLVGAPRYMIRSPFLIEGTLEGALGSMLAVSLFWVVWRLALSEVAVLGFVMPTQFLDGASIGVLIFAGALLGTAGGAISLWRFTREVEGSR